MEEDFVKICHPPQICQPGFINIGAPGSKFCLESNSSGMEYLNFYIQNYNKLEIPNLEGCTLYCPCFQSAQHVCPAYIIRYVLAISAERKTNGWLFSYPEIVRPSSGPLSIDFPVSDKTFFAGFDSIFQIMCYIDVKLLYKGQDQSGLLEAIVANGLCPKIISRITQEAMERTDHGNVQKLICIHIIVLYTLLVKRWKTDPVFRDCLEKSDWFLFSAQSLELGVGPTSGGMYTGLNLYGWLLTFIRWSYGAEIVSCAIAKHICIMYLMAVEGKVHPSILSGLDHVCQALTCAELVQTVRTMFFTTKKKSADSKKRLDNGCFACLRL